MLKVAILLGLAAFVAAGRLDGRIVGGDVADIKNFPFQVSVRDRYDEHSCGGVILNKNTIVTAAHCTEEETPKTLAVRVGSTDNNKGDLYRIAKIIDHPDYNEKTVDFDISIFKLTTNIVFKPTVQPIAMIETGKEVIPGTLGSVSGWGALKEGSEDTPRDLRSVLIAFISDADCYKFNGKSKITKNMLCARSLDKDTCTGDSGGPFVQNNKLVGLVSWSFGCANNKYAGVYTKISVLRPWVEKYL